MRKFLSMVLAMSGLLFSVQLSAQTQTGLIREYYVCNYLAGKDLGSLMAARDAAVEVMGEQIEATSFLWTPIKTNGESDFVWFNQWENLNAWGNWNQNYYRDRTYNELMENFTDMSKCGSGIMHHVPIWQGGEFQVTTGPATVVAYTCNFLPGGTMAEVNAAAGHLSQVLMSLGNHQNFNVFMHVPLVNNTGRDVFIFGVYPSISEYAQGVSILQNSSEYAAVVAHFQSQVRCDTSLWDGQMVIQPQE